MRQVEEEQAGLCHPYRTPFIFSKKLNPFVGLLNREEYMGEQGFLDTAFILHCLACADMRGPLSNISYFSVYSDEICLEGVFTYSDSTEQILIGHHTVNVIAGCPRRLRTEESKYFNFIDFLN